LVFNIVSISEDWVMRGFDRLIYDLWPSWWFGVDVNSGLEFLHRVDVGSVASVQKAQIPKNRIKVNRD
jgi:hypothetical protein